MAGVVALVGNPGAGKSRLAEETTALARAQGLLTLHAAASGRHTDLHCGVIVEALRPVVRTVEAGARTRLVEGLPDLGRLIDGLGLPGPVSLGDPSMERTRLFEAAFRLLDRLTRQQPVHLVVEDIWADPASLAVLHYVVRGLVDRRFLTKIFIERTPMCPAIPRCGSCCRTPVGCPITSLRNLSCRIPHNPDAPQADPLVIRVNIRRCEGNLWNPVVEGNLWNPGSIGA